MSSVVDFAYEIIAMYEENKDLRNRVAELEGYKNKYNSLINNQDKYMGDVVSFLMEPSVAEGIFRNFAKKEKKNNG